MSGICSNLSSFRTHIAFVFGYSTRLYNHVFEDIELVLFHGFRVLDLLLKFQTKSWHTWEDHLYPWNLWLGFYLFCFSVEHTQSCHAVHIHALFMWCYYSIILLAKPMKSILETTYSSLFFVFPPHQAYLS